MLQVTLVLYDSGDGVVSALEVEGVRTDIVVREPLHKVQCKHWRQTIKHKARQKKQKVVIGIKSENPDRL